MKAYEYDITPSTERRLLHRELRSDGKRKVNPTPLSCSCRHACRLCSKTLPCTFHMLRKKLVYHSTASIDQLLLCLGTILTIPDVKACLISSISNLHAPPSSQPCSTIYPVNSFLKRSLHAHAILECSGMQCNAMQWNTPLSQAHPNPPPSPQARQLRQGQAARTYSPCSSPRIRLCLLHSPPFLFPHPPLASRAPASSGPVASKQRASRACALGCCERGAEISYQAGMHCCAEEWVDGYVHACMGA